MIKKQEIFAFNDFGKPNHPVVQLSVASHHHKSHLPLRYAYLLHGVAQTYQPKVTLELGTSTGVGTLAMSSVSDNQVYTIEAVPEFQQAASAFSNAHQLHNITYLNGTFETQLEPLLKHLKKVDMVFVDGNHRYEPTMRYCKTILPYLHENSILILDDIYWSEEMKNVWEEIKNWPEVKVSIDVYRMGILFFNSNQAKENFRLYYF